MGKPEKNEGSRYLSWQRDQQKQKPQGDTCLLSLRRSSETCVSEAERMKERTEGRKDKKVRKNRVWQRELKT